MNYSMIRTWKNGRVGGLVCRVGCHMRQTSSFYIKIWWKFFSGNVFVTLKIAIEHRVRSMLQVNMNLTTGAAWVILEGSEFPCRTCNFGRDVVMK